MTNTVVVESHATTRTTTISKESIKASTSTQNDNKRPNPTECLEKGLWEIEIIYYTISNGHRSLHNVLGIDPKHKRRGKIYKCLADNEYKVFESHDGIFYWPGDSVYLETAFNDPYIVATISNFKPAKREQISMKLTRYYRPEDIPEVTYQLLGQERKEHNLYEKMLKFESRELFQNEIACSYPISFLRGKCVVKSYRNITELDEIQLEQENIFFSCFNYNLDSNRLVPFHGTIRQGPRHQVDVPPMPTESVSEDRDRDQLLYRPGQICQSSEEQYIRSCRAYRTLCLSRKPQISQLEKDARLGDLLFDDAINNLHNCRYNIEEAQHVMNEHDNQLTEDNSFLTAEDVKKFTKGIKNYGKNFTKIQKELLPYHMREHLVNFYYMWKKSRDATRPRAIQRARPPPKKGFKNGTPLRPTSADLIDYASASEDELGDIEERACHHCYSLKSKDWHHAGFFRQLLCTECRLYFKKYGSMREVQKPIAMPLCLHRGSPIDEGVRTRANGKHRRQMESPNDDKLSRKSRKRLHRHSAASDDLQENSNTKRINKKKTNGEPNDGEESESESSSSGKQKSKKVNGYQSSSSSASSPSAKEEQIEEEPKKENGIIKTEIKEEKLVEIKDEKENFYIKKEIEEEDGASCFLTESELKKHIEECAKDVDEKVSIIILQNSGGKRELRSTNGEKLPILESAVFEQVIQRPSKSTCARTDFIYHNSKPISWMEKRRIREEKRERELFLERRRREEEEKMRTQSIRPSTSQPPTTTPIISVPMPNIMQQKTAMELLNGPSDQMANVIQRIQMGAIPQPMPMMGGMDPRIMLQQHAQHQTALMMMIQMQEQQKIQAQIQQQEAQRIAEQRKLEEQKRQQEQRQREVAAVQAAQMNGIKQSMPVQAQNMLQAQQLQQLMMNQQLFSNNPLMMAALIQQQQQQGQLAAAQAQAEYENRKRYEMEIQHRMVQQQRAAVEAQLQQQHQQHSVAAALSQFANMVGGGSNVPGPAPTSNAEQMFLSMMQQQQQHPMALLEAIRKYSEARTA